ncbi:hypothetical protein B0H19DRAFT_1080204 [Mycena capillaripes]|nr:hypothetical protein B0H19DRAFT_1080204 [Mycena capillaripes]
MSEPIWHTTRGYGVRALVSRTPAGSEYLVENRIARFGRADCSKLRDVNLFSDSTCEYSVIPYSDRDQCLVDPMFDGWAGESKLADEPVGELTCVLYIDVYREKENISVMRFGNIEKKRPHQWHHPKAVAFYSRIARNMLNLDGGYGPLF